MRTLRVRLRRLGQGRELGLAAWRGPALPERSAFDGDEARAEALQAGVILVARRLVDHALATELGLERLDREAVRGDAAVPAAFADELVDDDAPGRVGELAALAAPALLGRAGLHVDDRGDALLLAQLALHRVELLARADRDPGRPREARRERLLLVDDG